MMDFKKSLLVLVLSIFLIIGMGSVLGAANFTVTLVEPGTNATFFNASGSGLGLPLPGRFSTFNCSVTNSTGTGMNITNISIVVYNRTGGGEVFKSRNNSGVSFAASAHLGSYNFTSFFNTTNVIANLSENQGYRWTCQACADINGSLGDCAYASGNNTFHIDQTAPVVTILAPNYTAWHTNNTIFFGFVANDSNEKSCNLWGNFNGTTLAHYLIGNGTPNQTQGFNNRTNANFTVLTLIDSTNYTWTVNCTDLANNTAFANANFSFRLDTTDPSPTQTNPTTEGIYVLDSISFTCDGTDPVGGATGSNVSKCELVTTKPDGSTATKKVDCGVSTAIKDSETELAGGYKAQCKATDNAGLGSALTTAYSFTVYSRTSGTSATAGTVSGGPTATYTLNLVTKEEASVSKYESGSVTFSLDGTVVHKITFTKVTSDSVTLKIESTPKTVTLKVGEMQKVDVNNDGKNDIEVKLESISEGGKANIITKRVEAVVPVTKPAEVPTKPAEVPTKPAEVPTKPAEAMKETKGVSTFWWWVIGIVVVVIVVWFVMRKK